MLRQWGEGWGFSGMGVQREAGGSEGEGWELCEGVQGGGGYGDSVWGATVRPSPESARWRLLLPEGRDSGHMPPPGSARAPAALGTSSQQLLGISGH